MAMMGDQVHRNRASAFLVAMLGLVLLISGCSGSSSSDPQQSSSDKVSVSIASGTSGGVYYMVGAALAQVIQKYNPDITANSEATGGTSENIRLVAGETATIGMGMCDDIIAAYEGKREHEGKPATNLRALMAGPENVFHLIVRADSDIKSLADIKGKRVSLGPSGAPYFGPGLIEAVTGYKNGTDYKGQYLGHDQAAEALQNGDVDLVVATLAYPASAYSNLALTQKVRFLSLTDEEMAKVLEANPAWRDTKIPAGTYEGMESDSRVPAVPVWLFTHESVPEDVIYRCVKAILEHTDELAQVHPDAGKYKLETAQVGITIPIHPGAERYYQEQK